MNPPASPRLNRAAVLALAKALAHSQLRGAPAHPLVVRLLRDARVVSAATGGQSTASDLVSEMVLVLLEKVEQLGGQTEAYIRRRCRWEAQHRAEAGRTYRRYCPEMPLIADDDGDTAELSELTPSDSLSPEDALIQREERAERQAWLKRLRAQANKQGARYFDGVLAGQSTSEIAEQNGVSRPAISNGLRALRRKALQIQTQPVFPGRSDKVGISCFRVKSGQ